MRLKRVRETDLGDAISMEDAISMLTIIFVLFVVFLVPLISIDKARLEAKLHDSFWDNTVKYLVKNPTKQSNEIKKYASAFELEEPIANNISEFPSKNYLIIEQFSSDSSLTVIKHNTKTNQFSSMRMSKNGSSTTFRNGKLAWSRVASEWYFLNNEINYGEDERSIAFNNEYRSWRKIGFSKNVN